MAVAITVTPAGSALNANRVQVTGLAAVQVVVLYRQHEGETERIPGTFTATSGGVAQLDDYLYPFDVPIQYVVYDSTETNVLATSAVVPAVPSGGMPWINDVVFPGIRRATVTIVDVLDRTRPGRVSTYSVAAQQYPIAIGDVRLGSTGSLQLLCRSHAERDNVIYALSSGNPCVLRIPTACQVVVDEMTFSPLDIRETRLSTSGACLLGVDYVEVEIGDVGSYVPVTYGAQTTNAAAASLLYGTLNPPPATGLSANFKGKTYKDMYLSQTGIRP